MEIKANSFSIRGESGVVKVVSDSPFVPGGSSVAYTPEAECDVAIESDGFRLNKAVVLEMGPIVRFLGDLKAVVEAGSGSASYSGGPSGLRLRFIIAGGESRVECEMDDANEGKENSIRIKYPIEPAYFEDLRRFIAGAVLVAQGA